MPFEKILIANRGEIAARIIKTCKKLNISTVAIYSEADKESPYVKMADERYFVGGARVQESYVNIDNIMDVAKMAKVDAIHPGYGFLSENPMFAKRCEDEGITFIGPKAEVMEKMGSKIAARKTMEEAGVPIVPGTNYPLVNVVEAMEFADAIGYPVMLKASAGGGGIGMQIVENDEEIQSAFERNQGRARNFF